MTSDKITIVGKIDAQFERVRKLVLERNESWGNAIFAEKGIVSQLGPKERIMVALDHKLHRLKEKPDATDTIDDIIGYLILLLVWERGGT